MKTFEFEIQGLISVEIEAEDVRDARIKLINTLSDYEDELMSNASVSDGVEK